MRNERRGPLDRRHPVLRGDEPGGRGGHRGGHRGHEHRRGDCAPDAAPIPESCRSFQSAQTFRRGRAIAFLERLQVMRATLVQQLNQPEFESIRPVISGELKAIDNVIGEFIHSFELREIPSPEPEYETGTDRARGSGSNES